MNSRGRKRVSRRPNKTSRAEQRKPIGTAAGRFDAFESGNRRVPVVNHHRIPGADLAQIGAKVVF